MLDWLFVLLLLIISRILMLLFCGMILSIVLGIRMISCSPIRKFSRGLGRRIGGLVCVRIWVLMRKCFIMGRKDGEGTC